MLVREVMGPCVVAIHPGESAALAARLLARHNVGALPVCAGDGQLRGVVTDRDLVLRCLAAEEDPRQVPVGRIMTRHPAQVAPGDDVRLAAQTMARHQVRRLPVVEAGRVVGMVSLGDLARCGKYEMEISRALTEISGNVRRP
ncbi:MAG TPA: CBS domain-containing protein [Candidatus Evtepia faecavium]|nr:CBS domain-containing protein [Candidatus Evtepia faecavium]